MFNLFDDTNHEAGIIVYGDNSVGVYNWTSCSDHVLPLLSPFGTPINWPKDVDDGAEITHVDHVDDVRNYLPGTVFDEGGQIATNMDIVYDENEDIPGLFGFGPAAGSYEGCENPYSGDIWTLPTGEKVITIDLWN